jgi:broad specificity phosphatase PhoE
VFDFLFHSGYRRTVETTEAIVSAYTEEERRLMHVRHHLFVRERDAGHAYDMTDAEAVVAFPWLQDYWTTFGPFFARSPAGRAWRRSASAFTASCKSLRGRWQADAFS